MNDPAPCAVARHGAWPSPLGAGELAGGTLRLGAPAASGDDLYWIEVRPQERGRHVVVHRGADGRIRDRLAPPWDARTRVHEYGGGQLLVEGSIVWFCHAADQRLHRQVPGAPPSPLTPEGPYRYADGVLDGDRDRIVCVREDHGGTAAGDAEPVHALVEVPGARGGEAPGEVRVLVEGADFYAAPRLDPAGRRLAWVSWDHPDMPWDRSELWVAELDGDGRPGEPTLVAGGEGESVYQPAFSPDGTLHFVSDRSGWWNLYRWRGGTVEPVIVREAELGKPHWVFRTSTYGFTTWGGIVCAFHERGRWRLARAGADGSDFTELDVPFTELDELRVEGDTVYFVGGAPASPTAIVELDPITGEHRAVRRESELELAPEAISVPRAVSFSTSGGATAHGLFYAPRNPACRGPEGERPPLLVLSHGGPTAAASSALNLQVQFWTTRGFAVLDVDYRGSTGYGRAYRNALEGGWGVLDVDDCVAGARHLVEAGEVDGDRLAIRGRSAGGYTTLAALTFREVFHAGASYYGVSDLEALARDTHKFEARYLDRLVGPYPEQRERYRQRSPLHFAERITCPVVFFQGGDDRVVPPDQAEAMVEALRAAGCPVEYLRFEGEGHGFRQAATIERCLETELSFYARVFGFAAAG